MYNKELIDNLISFVESHDGINDKDLLAEKVISQFNLQKDRKVYYCEDFAIRFSKGRPDGGNKLSNTILSLSALLKYDESPFFVCVVTPTKNHLILANTTFLKKISHSSKELRVDNIKGSFNGSDIMYELDEITNDPSQFDRLFAYHTGVTRQDNIERLVEATNEIEGKTKRFEVNSDARKRIFESIERADQFINSIVYTDLIEDLDSRVSAVKDEIVLASEINNVNLRGRVIEYLITESFSDIKEEIINALHDGTPLPEFITKDDLGDYRRGFDGYFTETDIKTKVLWTGSNPKAYNVDKLLEFLSEEESVYLIFLLGIDENGNVTTRLVSVFDERLIRATNVVHHWAGRNTRGAAQFMGEGLERILVEDDFRSIIDVSVAECFINVLIEK